MHTHTHTQGPWKVMPCPQHHGKHPFHDSRWIATNDAVPEYGYDPRSWMLESGHLICEMRDGNITANARLIAAAPDMLAELHAVRVQLEAQAAGYTALEIWPHVRAESIRRISMTIHKAEGNA